MKELTDQQQKVLGFVESHQAEHGFPPTLREIGAAVGLPNVSAVRGHLSALEKKGYITKDPDKARSIQLVHSPSTMSRLKRRIHELARTDDGVVHHVVYALAWTTWHRQAVLVGPLAAQLAKTMEREAVERGWTLLKCDIRPDCVAVVVKVWPNHSAEQTVRRFQAAGVALRRRLGKQLDLRRVWERGYAAATDPGMLDELITDILREQP
jgi:REP element-mobilizing transposase RayT